MLTLLVFVGIAIYVLANDKAFEVVATLAILLGSAVAFLIGILSFAFVFYVLLMATP
jgi:hypothetical protein